jgi:RNA polymerase sigma-70 factor (ECF subfamily)
MDRPSEGNESMLEQFRPYLLLFARLHLDARLRGKLDASDVVQNTLCEACQSPERFHGRSAGEVAGWLRQALIHQMSRAVRDLGRARRNVARERSLDEALDDSSARLEAWLAAEQSSPSAQAEHGEQTIRLTAAVEALPDAQREAVVLHYLHGRTLRQVAQSLGRSEAAVAGLLQRGLKELRKVLCPPE